MEYGKWQKKYGLWFLFEQNLWFMAKFATNGYGKPFAIAINGMWFWRIFEQNLWFMAEIYLNRKMACGLPYAIYGHGKWRIFEEAPGLVWPLAQPLLTLFVAAVVRFTGCCHFLASSTTTTYTFSSFFRTYSSIQLVVVFWASAISIR
jgi:hypothetical protein